MTTRPETREHVRRWIDAERSAWADVKFSGDNDRLVDRCLTDGWEALEPFLLNYLKRVSLFSLRTQQGRQALGKAIVTATDWLERACERYGAMPEPGATSGDVVRWVGESDGFPP